MDNEGGTIMDDLVEYATRSLIWKRRPESLEEVAGVAGAINWFLDNEPFAFGDFFNTITDLFGEAASQLMPDIERSKKTLLKWLYVCRTIPPDERVYDLPFSHYAEVVNLICERRHYLLKIAEQEKWSVARLRKEIKGEKDKKPKMIECPSCHVVFEAP